MLKTHFRAAILLAFAIGNITTINLDHVSNGDSHLERDIIQKEINFENFMLFLETDPEPNRFNRLNRDTYDHYNNEETFVDDLYESSGEETDNGHLFGTPIIKIDDSLLGNAQPEVSTATGSTTESSTAKTTSQLSTVKTTSELSTTKTTSQLSTITQSSSTLSSVKHTDIEGPDKTTKVTINKQTTTATSTDKSATTSSATPGENASQAPSENVTKAPASAQTGIIFIVGITLIVILIFICIFIYRQVRKRMYGEYQEVSKNGPINHNGTELHRFDAVDSDANEMVSVPLTADFDDNNTNSFKDSNLSPVNIVTDDIAVDSNLLQHPLTVQYSNTPQEHAISNRGGRVKIVPGNGNSSISGGPLGDAVYNLDHCVILWGDSDLRGSAHTVNGRPFAAEIHFVHWNKSTYSSFQEASKTPGGLAIVAAFIKVDNDHGNQLTQICDNVKHIAYKSQSWRIPHFLTSTMLPEDSERYCTYSGSLTSPPYTSDVTWIIFSHPISASKTQMHEFHSLKYHEKDEGHGMSGEKKSRKSDYHLTIQPLGSRIIRTAVKQS